MANYKFLIIGSNGLLGSNIVKILKKKNYAYATCARSNSNFNIDLKNFNSVKKIFNNNNFEIVINCAAKVDINFCEKYYPKAKKINSDFLKLLAQLSKRKSFKLTQISTDHVYKGQKLKLNSENAKLFAINKYAKTKILAERHLKKLKKYLIIRTNFTGKGKNSFFDWLYKNIKKGKKINLFYDMYTSTLNVKKCAELIIKLTLINSKGIYNLGTKNMLTKKEYAENLSKIMQKKFVFTTSSVDILKVPRGKNLGLDVRKIEKKLNLKMISANKAIANCLKEYL